MTCPLCGAPTRRTRPDARSAARSCLARGPSPTRSPSTASRPSSPACPEPEVAAPTRYRRKRVLLAIPVALLVLVTVVTARGLAGDDRPEARELDSGRIFELPLAVPRHAIGRVGAGLRRSPDDRLPRLRHRVRRERG